MLTLLIGILLWTHGAYATHTPDPRIQNVVVLMLENRSFDHMLGHLSRMDSHIRGPNGTESNPVDTRRSNSPVVPVSYDAVDCIGIDPGHDYSQTAREIWGQDTLVDPAPMNGFVWANLNHGPEALRVMQLYNMSSLPVLSQLALEYAVCDAWYASVPSVTQTNRLYVHSGTSYGRIHSPTKWEWASGEYAPQTTFYQQLEAEGISWGIYYSDFPMALELAQLRGYPTHIRPIAEFYDQAKRGTLPQYTFLEPRWFDFLWWPENDMHPGHCVRYGEYLIADVYNVIRNSPQWDNTLLIVVFDEHGGLWDHVPTPQHDIPAPDHHYSKDPVFYFDRLGVRVPAVLVSPWISLGTVLHDPPDCPQGGGCRYEHTSIMRTVRRLLGLQAEPLTAREAWAGMFDHVLRSTARPVHDCPEVLSIGRHDRRDYATTNLVNAMDISAWLAALDVPCYSGKPLSDLQQDLVVIAWSLMKDPNTTMTDLMHMDSCTAAKYVRNELAAWQKQA